MNREEIDKQAMDFIESGRAKLYKETYMAFTAFADHILRVAESKRWRPIETAPRDKTKILVMGNHSDDEYRPYLKERKDLFWYAVACWDGWREDEDRFSRLKRDSHYWVFCKDGHSTFTKPTHWMPLPSAPEEKRYDLANAKFFVGEKKIGAGPASFEFCTHEQFYHPPEGEDYCLACKKTISQIKPKPAFDIKKTDHECPYCSKKFLHIRAEKQ